MRCQEIMNNLRDPFGGLSVLLLGDLLQLPPVLSPHVFKTLTAHLLQKYFKAPPILFNLWTHFEYDELTENMRQGDSSIYAQIMSRMRVQALTPEDIECLKSRLIPINEATKSIEEAASYYCTSLIEKDPHALAIFATNQEVAKFNSAVVDELQLDVITIESKDSWEDEPPKDGVFQRIYQKAGYRITDGPIGEDGVFARTTTNFEDNRLSKAEKAANMEKTLKLAVNGRVMLRRNLNKALGMINGSTGVLIDYDRANNPPTFLTVSFDR